MKLNILSKKIQKLYFINQQNIIFKFFSIKYLISLIYNQNHNQKYQFFSVLDRNQNQQYLQILLIQIVINNSTSQIQLNLLLIFFINLNCNNKFKTKNQPDFFKVAINIKIKKLKKNKIVNFTIVIIRQQKKSQTLKTKQNLPNYIQIKKQKIEYKNNTSTIFQPVNNKKDYQIPKYYLVNIIIRRGNINQYKNIFLNFFMTQKFNKYVINMGLYACIQQAPAYNFHYMLSSQNTLIHIFC
eukprot:TRINITY_DN10394_c0_g3_i2.p1 TRINITY_DN10394_c0_g3~~TRINITY_DN10394_c0_g3_i2.p1  ORF type:complete len:241 (+),score=-4.53 TRINITY_DN10394_c0_g3_i2:136-858(+)